MCTVLDKVENRGIEKGRIEGRAEGRTEGKAEGKLEGKVSVYYQDMGWSPERIAEKTGKPVDTILQIIQSLE